MVCHPQSSSAPSGATKSHRRLSNFTRFNKCLLTDIDDLPLSPRGSLCPGAHFWGKKKEFQVIPRHRHMGRRIRSYRK